MQQFTKCKFGFCGKEIEIANVNNRCTWRHICDECIEQYTPYFAEEAQTYVSRIWRSAKKMVDRAERRGKYEVTITFEDVLRVWPVNNICPVMGILMMRGEENKRKASPSLDRIDSSKGYTPDNIQIVSMLANRLMTDATSEELLTFSKWINKTHSGK